VNLQARKVGSVRLKLETNQRWVSPLLRLRCRSFVAGFFNLEAGEVRLKYWPSAAPGPFRIKSA